MVSGMLRFCRLRDIAGPNIKVVSEMHKVLKRNVYIDKVLNVILKEKVTKC